MRTTSTSFLSLVAKDLLDIYDEERIRDFHVSIFPVMRVRNLDWASVPFVAYLLDIDIVANQISSTVPRGDLESFLVRDWKYVRPIRLYHKLDVFIDLPCGILKKRLKWIKILSPAAGGTTTRHPKMRGGGLLIIQPPYIVTTLVPLYIRGRVNVTVADFRWNMGIFPEIWKYLIRILPFTTDWEEVIEDVE